MNVPRFFKSRRPAPPQPEPLTTEADIFIAHAWMLTLTQWWAMTDFERAECRRNVITAPRFQP